MGLYLAVFDDSEELDGVEVGLYSDFSAFRNAVVSNLEPGGAGSKFPTLILHSDCDGQWTPEEAKKLVEELKQISSCFCELPAVTFNSDWQKEIAKTHGIAPKSLYECFIDVDGEPLLDRLISLARLSSERSLPILFQ